jgi:Spy/CpxP family protein refolding chaperone
MHPGFFWRRAQGACSEGAGCGPRGQWHGGGGGHAGHGWHGGPFGHGGGGGEDDSGGFGVRRPLRFLAFKLELNDGQVSELASILSELKTERAQAAVDHRRTLASLADVVAADAFDEARAKEATDARVKSHERVQGAVTRAVGRIHGILQPEQRTKLAYLLRTGALEM